MLSAKDVMTRNPVAVGPRDTIVQAAHLLLRYSISGLPVVGPTGQVLGIITEYELLDLVRNPATAQDMVEKRMSAPAWTVAIDDTVGRVIDVLRERHIRRVPVVDQHGRLVGIIARRDLLRAGCALVGRKQQQQWLATLLGT